MDICQQATVNAKHRFVLLLALALLSGQVFAQQHLHFDEELTTSCLDCAHLDAAPTLESEIELPEDHGLANMQSTFVDNTAESVYLTHYRSRAPPQA